MKFGVISLSLRQQIGVNQARVVTSKYSKITHVVSPRCCLATCVLFQLWGVGGGGEGSGGDYEGLEARGGRA